MKVDDALARNEILNIIESPLYKKLGVKLTYGKLTHPIFRDLKKKIDFYEAAKGSIPRPHKTILEKWAVEILSTHRFLIKSIQQNKRFQAEIESSRTKSVTETKTQSRVAKKKKATPKKSKRKIKRKTLKELKSEVGKMFPFLQRTS